MSTDARVVRTRELVSATVRDILAEEGWESVTHLRVAQRAKLSRATIYTHWPTKDALLRDALEEVAFTANVPLQGVLRDDLLAVLNLVASHLRDKALTRAFAAFVDRSEWDTDLERVKAELIEDVAIVIRTILSDAAERGELRPAVDVHRGAAQLMGPLMWRRYMSGEPISREFVEAVVDDFIAPNSPS